MKISERRYSKPTRKSQNEYTRQFTAVHEKQVYWNETTNIDGVFPSRGDRFFPQMNLIYALGSWKYSVPFQFLTSGLGRFLWNNTSVRPELLATYWRKWGEKILFSGFDGFFIAVKLQRFPDGSGGTEHASGIIQRTEMNQDPMQDK